jgi:hypothetical protein
VSDLHEDITPSESTRDRLIAIMRRKLGERGYTGAALEANLEEILS